MLHIQTILKGERTCLTNSVCTQPFKLADITENKNDKELQLMLMSSSPGILENDHYQLKIETGEGCSLRLHTQSYQRLFEMKEGATQQTTIELASNSSFCYLPHPSVPHERSSFVSTTDIHLGENCRLIFGEILTCGRKLNGESFKFSKYQHITRIWFRQKLVIMENLLIMPGSRDMNMIGLMEGYTHQASLICLDPTADIKKLKVAARELLTAQNDIIFGISAAPVNGIIVRILGQKAEQLFDCLKQIADSFSKAVCSATFKV